MTQLPNTLILGAGIFGVTAALELRQRGHRVQLLEPGPLPHPLAASTDISKAIRMDYGSDDDYTEMGEQAINLWRQWNAQFGETLYHEVGMMFARRRSMDDEGDYERESFLRLQQRGHDPLRLTPDVLRQRFPAWNAERYVDGYYNAFAGYAESGKVVAKLLERAKAQGVEVHEGQTFAHFIENGSRVGGVITRDGARFTADMVVVATGSWTPHILPELAPVFRSPGMPVFHLKPVNPELFVAERFPVFAADITASGYYGFPLHPINQVVKIANHGIGRQMHPESAERAVTAQETEQLRDFLRETFPTLTDAPIIYTRVCLYCDTWDGHFWIARDPQREGVVVATGGSGHAFKFAPLLGGLSADAVEGKTNAWSHKFRWRPEVRMARVEEEARYQG
jgi:glycine/D-amino acid oxidase-like deaminating enzyme